MDTAAAARGPQKLHVSSPRAGAGWFRHPFRGPQSLPGLVVSTPVPGANSAATEAASCLRQLQKTRPNMNQAGDEPFQELVETLRRC
ncbi:hypothetical protein Baya_16090 [Bagarius yarrelli]|uniref:Uncharacterized protein n=1 Tax=Bagarius yarrelli TaxID=175774 RepID=A0A556VUD7_BAGYA|nr:hypothetical protein Baya_16090 [Bagarius yarrelli]